MTIQCKPESPVRLIHIMPHIKCVILNVNNKNTLYEFNEGNKFIDDLSVYITKEDIERVKRFLEPNSKMKFNKKPNIGNQLKLF